MFLHLGIGSHGDCSTKLFDSHKHCCDGQLPLIGSYFKRWCFYVSNNLHWIPVGMKIGKSIVFEVELITKWRLKLSKISGFGSNVCHIRVKSIKKCLNWSKQTSCFTVPLIFHSSSIDMKLNFSCSALFHTTTEVCLIFWPGLQDCSTYHMAVYHSAKNHFCADKDYKTFSNFCTVQHTHQ